MLKAISYLLICSLMHHSSYAQQPCNDELIINTKGSWKKNSDTNPFPDQGFPKNQFPMVTNRIDKMQKLLKAAYPEPKGIEAQWYRSISGGALIKDGPVPYVFSALFLAYFCNTYENKIEPGGETSTWFYVWANQFNWFAEHIEIYAINKLPVYLLNKKVGEINGYAVYEGYNNGKPAASVHNRAVILTRAGQSPYLPVTQKQFLKAFINYHETRNSKLLADLEKNTTVLTDEEEAADKKRQLEKIERTTTPERLARAKDNFLKNYISSAQRKEASIAQSKKYYEDELRPARILLADSLIRDLEQPAILSYDNMLEFKEFITEDKGGQQLVRLNPDYFNMTLPKYIPQLLIVYWSWGMGKAELNFKNELEANFNFNALKEMIDK